MGRIGTVLSWAVRTFSGYVKNDTGANLIQSTLFTDSGVDAPPMAGDSIVSVSTQSKGRPAAVGVIDTKNASSAAPGERRTYARDAAGAPIVTQYLQKDGTASLSNANGSITLLANGDVVATNGVSTFSLVAGVATLSDGTASATLSAGALSIIAPGGVDINGATVTAAGAIQTALGVDSDLHGHPQGDDSGGNSQVETDAPTPTP